MKGTLVGSRKEKRKQEIVKIWGQPRKRTEEKCGEGDAGKIRVESTSCTWAHDVRI